jgi:hypothetical protein
LQEKPLFHGLFMEEPHSSNEKKHASYLGTILAH